MKKNKTCRMVVLSGNNDDPQEVHVLYRDDEIMVGNEIIGVRIMLSDFANKQVEIGAFSFHHGLIHQYTKEELDEQGSEFSEESKWIKVTCAVTWMILRMIAFDFTNPNLYLCKRSPKIPNGHTISWQKAREHYVLLHKSHTANRKEHLGKALVTDGPVIDRIAHSRRAHFRMLRSPRFTHKRGQRIWVQSAWVGPKEWTDHSGQIYRIIERPNGGFAV